VFTAPCSVLPWALPHVEILDEAAALRDVLRLSRGMTYKAAVADLRLGGGKAVVIADARTEKTPELLEAFGKAVESVAGRYITAEDVGMSVKDIDTSATSPSTPWAEAMKAAQAIHP